MTPHIAIDVRMARDSGIGTYIRSIVPRVIAARPSWRFTLLGRSEDLRGLGILDRANVAVRDCTARIYTAVEQLELRRETPRGVDLFWAPHYNIPLLHRGPLLVTVHDVIHLAMPRYAGNPVKRGYARFMFAAVQRRADAIITVSEFSRAEFRRLVGTGRADPVVIHNGVSELWHGATASPVADGAATGMKPYVLFVGNVKPHKNLGTLVRAFALLKDALPHDLVVIGRREGLRGPDSTVAAEATRLLGDRVRFAGEVNDEALRRYVAGASALVAPSLYEGFGLPPLEAMAVGCPALVSRAAAFPEVCGDAAAYCDATNADDMARSLRALLTDGALRAGLIARGRARAASFTWDRSASTTVSVLESTLCAR